MRHLSGSEDSCRPHKTAKDGMCVEVCDSGFARPVHLHVLDVPLTLPLIQCPVRTWMCMLNIRTAVFKNRLFLPTPPNVELDFLLTRSQDCCCSRGLMLFTSSFDIATSLRGFLNNAAVQERWRGWGWGEGKGGEIISSAIRAIGGGGGRGGSQQTSEFSRFMILHEWTAGSWESRFSLEWEGASWESGCF